VISFFAILIAFCAVLVVVVVVDVVVVVEWLHYLFVGKHNS